MQNFKFSPVRWLLLIFVLSSNLSAIEAREIKAKLSWFNLTKLSFRVNGVVTKLHVKPGDYIKKKQKIINLDQREFIDNVSLTDSLRKSRKSELDEAKRELNRAVELFDRTVLSEHELQTIKNNFIASETRHITAKINWLKAKRDLEFSNIVAPFNAIVLDVVLKEYETVISSFKSDPAIIIAAADKISAKFMLNADDITRLQENEAIEVVIKGSSYKGTLFFPSLLPVNNLYPVSVVLSIPFGKVRAEMDAIVKIR